MSNKLDELIDALLALPKDKEFNRMYKKLNLKVSVYDKGDDYVEMRFDTRFALYDVVIDEDLHNTFSIRTGIIETAYGDIDELIELGIDGTLVKESLFDMPDDDIKSVVEEIINQTFDDGSIEYMFKMLYKLMNNIEKLADDDVINDNLYTLGTFLKNLSLRYE